MAIKLLHITLLLVLSHLCKAQLEVIDIKLDKQQSTIEVIADSVFYIENKSFIKVNYVGDGRISRVINSEGAVKRISKNYYEITFPNSVKSTSTLLKFYETTPKNKVNLLLVKPFPLKRIPPPLITIGGVANDSAINIEHLFKDNYIRSFDSVNNWLLPTQAFTIHFSNQDSIRVKGNKIPLSLKPKMYNLTEGRRLTISNIHTTLPDRRTYVTREISVFLVNTDQYSVGKRKYIRP